MAQLPTVELLLRIISLSFNLWGTYIFDIFSSTWPAEKCSISCCVNKHQKYILEKLRNKNIIEIIWEMIVLFAIVLLIPSTNLFSLFLTEERCERDIRCKFLNLQPRKHRGISAHYQLLTDSEGRVSTKLK